MERINGLKASRIRSQLEPRKINARNQDRNHRRGRGSKAELIKRRAVLAADPPRERDTDAERAQQTVRHRDHGPAAAAEIRVQVKNDADEQAVERE